MKNIISVPIINDDMKELVLVHHIEYIDNSIILMISITLHTLQYFQKTGVINEHNYISKLKF